METALPFRKRGTVELLFVVQPSATALHPKSVALRAFHSVDGQDDHQAVQSVLRTGDLHAVGIGPLPELLGQPHSGSGSIHDGVVPFPKVALDGPVVAVQLGFGARQGELFDDLAGQPLSHIQFKLGQKGQDPFLHPTDRFSRHDVNLEPVSPAQLALDNIDCVTVLIKDVVAVEPGENLCLNNSLILERLPQLVKKKFVLSSIRYHIHSRNTNHFCEEEMPLTPQLNHRFNDKPLLCLYDRDTMTEQRSGAP